MFDVVISCPAEKDSRDICLVLQEWKKRNGSRQGLGTFYVFANPSDEPNGSGAGFIYSMYRYLLAQGITPNGDIESFLLNRNVLFISGGGESRRMPTFVPEFKMFMPVIQNGAGASALDLLSVQIDTFTKSYQWNKEGEVVAICNDVAIAGNLGCLREDAHIFAFAIPAPIKQGVSHGVFVFDHKTETSVCNFFQKADMETLAAARIGGEQLVAIDSGVVSFSPHFIADMIHWSGSTIIENSPSVIDLIIQSRIKFDLYSEIFIACTPGKSLQQYLIDTKKSPLNRDLLTELFRHFSTFTLQAHLVKNGCFLHFGTLTDYIENVSALNDFESECSVVPQQPAGAAQFSGTMVLLNSSNILMKTTNSHPVVFESCQNAKVYEAQGLNLFHGLSDIEFSSTIPKGVCIDVRNVQDCDFFCIYSVTDSFCRVNGIDELFYCGQPLPVWLQRHHLRYTDLAANGGQENDLLSLQLHCNISDPDFIAGYWQNDINRTWTERFLKSKRISLKLANSLSDLHSRIHRRKMLGMHIAAMGALCR